MVFIEEAAGAAADREAEIRGEGMAGGGCAGAGCPSTSVFIIAIGDADLADADGKAVAAKLVSSGPGGGSAFSMSRALRGRLSTSLSSARMTTSAVCFEIAGFRSRSG